VKEIKTIVLIHGWACDESIWQETKRYLDPKCRLYTINLSIMKTMHSYREAVIELIEQKGLDHVVLVGWSMGSLVAIQVASYLPHIVEGLILVSATSKFTSGIPPIVVTKMKKRLSKNPEKTVHDFYKLMFSSKEQALGLDDKIIDNYLSRRGIGDLQEDQFGLDFLLDVDVQEYLQHITCPALLLHGEEDSICPLEGAKFIERQLPCAQLVSYPGVGHIPFLTEFRKFHQGIEEWLAVL